MLLGYVSLTYVVVIFIFSLANVSAYEGFRKARLPTSLPSFLTCFLRLIFLLNFVFVIVMSFGKLPNSILRTKHWAHFD
jgi:hypothetical protein